MTTIPLLNQEVVRSAGDYVVGRIGVIVALDLEKNRAQVDWNNDPKTWVSFKVIEPTSIPYRIIPGHSTGSGRTYKYHNPKYVRK